MEEQYHTFEYIQRYLEGELSSAERGAFEETLKTDASLAEKVEQQRRTNRAVDVYAQMVTKERVKAIHEMEKQKRPATRFRRYAAAVGLALLLGAGGLYFYAQAQYSDRALVAASFEPYPDRLTTMGSEPEPSVAGAIRAYNEADYARAADLLAAIPASDPNYAAVRLYYGISLWQSGSPAAAAPILRELTLSTSPFQEAARWYLALALLENGQTEEAAEQLRLVAAAGGFQQARARQLLADLQSPWRKVLFR